MSSECGAMSDTNMSAPRSLGNCCRYVFVKVLITTNSTLPRMSSTRGQPLRNHDSICVTGAAAGSGWHADRRALTS